MRNFAISLITIILVLSGCRARSNVEDVWGYIQERPDSALAVLSTMNSATFHGRTLAEYRLLKAMALDKNYVDVSSDSLALPAYQYFRKHGPREKEMMSLYYLALSRYYAEDLSNAVLLLEEEIKMADELGNNLYIGFGYMVKSYAFSRTYCVSEAVKSAELGVAAFEAIPDTVHIQRAKLQLGDAYHSINEYEKAFDIYQELFSTCPKDTFTMRRALIHGAFSYYMMHPEKADSAMRYYERALGDYKATLGPVEAAHYGEVACMAGNPQLTHHVVNQLKSSGLNPEQCAYLEYKLNIKENKPWDALTAVEEFLTQQDSVLRTSLEQSLIKSQRQYQEQMRQAAEKALYFSKWRAFICTLCLLLILLVVFLYYSQKRRIAAIEREQLIGSVGEAARLLQESEQKNSELEENLQAAQKRYVAAYKKQFSKISSIIENYYTTSGMKDGRDLVYKQVMNIAGTIGSDQTRMSALEREVNLALDNAMKWYREEFPDKGASHYHWVCLLMAGFTTPMLELLTKTPRNTLYSKKSRLLEEIRNSSAKHKDLFLMVIK